MTRGSAVLLALALLAGPARAEAPETAPRPETREEPAAPDRPETRPGGALSLEVRPDGSPQAQVDPVAAPAPPSVRPVQRPAENDRPSAARRPPLLADGSAPAPLDGPSAVVRAELAMADPPPAPVIVGGWDGAGPPVRPGAEPPPAPNPPSGRPRLRPSAPDDPVPPLPPEPDAPPVYAPGARPGILPDAPGYSPYAVARAVPPSLRPPGIVERASQRAAELARGQICGNPAIQGAAESPVYGSGGCGIENPVRVRSVHGVRLSEPALMDCATAEALATWVRDAARPAIGSRGGGLEGLFVMGHYACRPRNNQAGARLSEHGRGRAIDIGGLILADGSTLSVARDWPDSALRQMYGAACGIFNTTLGPGSDGYHEDHLHFDTARGRGPYCR